MPTRPPRVCPRCGNAVDGRCPGCSPAWSNKPESWAGGSTRRWRRFRHAWLVEHPLCARCSAVATQVDHIVNLGSFPPGHAREAARYDWTNLQSLCLDHHKAKTAKESAVARLRARGQDPDPPAYAPTLF